MNNKEKNFISAVIYVHNSEDRIQKFLDTIIETLDENFEKYEIICVNDFSNDNSVEIIKKQAAAFSGSMISVLNLSYYHGVELSMTAGVDLSIGDFVLEFDSTVLDFAKEEIMNVYYKALEGYDIVNALPNKKQNITSRLFYNIFNMFAEHSYEMYTERFRILSRRVINRVNSINKTIPYRKVIYANCGLEATCLRYNVFTDEKYPIDSLEKKYRKKLAVDSLIRFTDVGWRLSMAMTFVMLFIVIGVTVYSINVYFSSASVEGWIITILFLSIAFFGLFGILTIVIKYLQILVNMIFKRKKYSVLSVDKLQ